MAENVDEVRGLIGSWLRAAGHRVRAVANGVEGVKALDSGPLDLLITDVLMAEADGLALIRAVQSRRPCARVVAISGGGRAMGASACLDMAKKLGAHASLFKPFSAAQLCGAIAAALE